MSRSGHFRQPATVAKTNTDGTGSINNSSDGVVINRRALHHFLMARGRFTEVPTGGIHRKAADPLEASPSAQSRWLGEASR